MQAAAVVRRQESALTAQQHLRGLCLCAAAQVNLKSELEAGWALRAGQQATALKEAQAKVAALEHSLQQVWTHAPTTRTMAVEQASTRPLLGTLPPHSVCCMAHIDPSFCLPLALMMSAAGLPVLCAFVMTVEPESKLNHSSHYARHYYGADSKGIKSTSM
jgi:hypothetical protein